MRFGKLKKSSFSQLGNILIQCFLTSITLFTTFILIVTKSFRLENKVSCNYTYYREGQVLLQIHSCNIKVVKFVVSGLGITISNFVHNIIICIQSLKIIFITQSFTLFRNNGFGYEKSIDKIHISKSTFIYLSNDVRILPLSSDTFKDSKYLF